MIIKYSKLCLAGKVKDSLIDWYEQLSSHANYTDKPVKTWDGLYHEETQPWSLDFNLKNTPEES